MLPYSSISDQVRYRILIKVVHRPREPEEATSYSENERRKSQQSRALWSNARIAYKGVNSPSNTHVSECLSNSRARKCQEDVPFAYWVGGIIDASYMRTPRTVVHACSRLIATARIFCQASASLVVFESYLVSVCPERA